MSGQKDRKSMKGVKVTITLPTYLLQEVDGLAEEAETFRSDVITSILDYVFDNEEILDEIFPYEEEGESETENQDENGDES
jgi:metal-responsive CopG/Arc/MetJ family transcriptional regulator